jgi:MerR family transcriptional regulator, light-induced transcriptional regulator
MSDLSPSADALDRDALKRAWNVFHPQSSRLHDQATRALAVEVLSRMEQSRRTSPIKVSPHPNAAELDLLCDALLRSDEAAASAQILQAHQAGVPIDTIYQGYLSGAAQQLGKMWDDDRVSSAEVVIAAGLIYGLMRGMRRLFGAETQILPDEFRAAFAATPGETHTLGVTMAADLLRRHGWQIDLSVGLDHDALVDKMGQHPFPIIGLSASSSRMIFPLARLIVALRLSNPGAWIMVNGKITDLEPDILSLVDADGIANDLESAEAQMEARMTAKGKVHQS